MGFSLFRYQKASTILCTNFLIRTITEIRFEKVVLEQQKFLFVFRIWNDSPGPCNQLGSDGNLGLGTLRNCCEINLGPLSPLLNLLFLSNCISK